MTRGNSRLPSERKGTLDESYSYYYFLLEAVSRLKVRTGTQAEHDGFAEFRRQKLEFGDAKWVGIYKTKDQKESCQGIKFFVLFDFYEILSCEYIVKTGEL